MAGDPQQPRGDVGARAEDSLEGRTIAGKFDIETLLGAGAMGSVYRARQVALDRAVAIKVMHRQLEADATYAARFDREAKAASRLDHPNLIRVLDYGREPDGLYYIAMEYLDGTDLFQLLEHDWPLSSARIVDLLSQTLAGLAAAHDAGVVHRDLKPENIMVLRRRSDDGSAADVVKVCDFGIAKVVGPTTRDPIPGAPRTRNPSTAGFVVGTPEFMSPEQAHGLELDARTDVYSVGVILYQLLTGRLPFEAATPLGVVLKLLHEEPTPPTELVPSVSPELEAICSKAMSKDPLDRYEGARAMRAALLGAPHDASSHPSLRRLPSEIANAPTMDFVPGPATASLRVLVAPKPRSRARLVGVVFGGAALLVAAFVLRTKLTRTVPQAPVETATAVAAPLPSPTSVASDVAAAATLAPVDSAPPLRTGPIVNGRHGRRHDPRKIDSLAETEPAPEPTSASMIATPAATPQAPAATAAPAVTTQAVPQNPTPQNPAPTATPPSFDPATAHVDLGTPRSMGISPGSITRALAPVNGKLTACYRASLNAANARGGTATLHIATDETGIITEAHVTGAQPLAASCFEAAVRGRTVPDVDTGSATADVPLDMRPR